MSNYPTRLVRKDGTVIRRQSVVEQVVAAGGYTNAWPTDKDSLRRQADYRRRQAALARLIFEVESTT